MTVPGISPMKRRNYTGRRNCERSISEVAPASSLLDKERLKEPTRGHQGIICRGPQFQVEVGSGYAESNQRPEFFENQAVARSTIVGSMDVVARMEPEVMTRNITASMIHVGTWRKSSFP
jgi:hypothetical protein